MVNFRKICAALLVGAVLPALAVTGSPSDTSDGRSQWFVKLKTTDVTDEQINQQIKNAGGDTHSRIIRIPDIYLAYSALLDDTKIKELREDKFVFTFPSPHPCPQSGASVTPAIYKYV